MSAQADEICDPLGVVRFACLSSTAEDLVAVPESEWIIGSGALRAINMRDHSEVVLFSDRPRFDAVLYGESCPGPIQGKEIDDKTFRAHGINLRPGRRGLHTLYIVHHSGRESIEIFELDMRGPTPAVTWIGCAMSPQGISGNGVAVLPDHGFAVTNFASRSLGGFGGKEGAPLRGKLESGGITGEVWEWRPRRGWSKVPGSEGAGPNGLEATKDGKYYFINEWGSQNVIRLSRGRSPVQKKVVAVDFHPDNLRWQADGSLLSAGQHGRVDAVLQSCLFEHDCSAVSTSVARIDTRSLGVHEILRQYPSNDYFAAGTTGLIVDGALWVGSTARGRRLAIFDLSP